MRLAVMRAGDVRQVTESALESAIERALNVLSDWVYAHVSLDDWSAVGQSFRPMSSGYLYALDLYPEALAQWLERTDWMDHTEEDL